MGKKWWWVYDSNVGRQSQRIYSPPQLATLVTHRTENAAHYCTSRKKKQPQKCKHPQKNQKHSRPYPPPNPAHVHAPHRPLLKPSPATLKISRPHLGKKCRHLCTSASLITTEIPTRLYNECRPCGGLRRPKTALTYASAGTHAVPAPPRKRRAFNPKFCPYGHKIQRKLFYEAKPITFRKRCKNAFIRSLCFVGLLAPRPRQHGMLHPK